VTNGELSSERVGWTRPSTPRLALRSLSCSPVFIPVRRERRARGDSGGMKLRAGPFIFRDLLYPSPIESDPIVRVGSFLISLL